MLGSAILWMGLSAIGVGDYPRTFGAKSFDQASFDAETFGDKKSMAREDDGLKVTLAPGQPEAGWKTPPTLRIGGDFTISATLVIRKLPKPGQEDGTAIGLAIGTQDVDQPEATLLRQVEMDGKDVYRPFEKADAAGQAQPMMMGRNRRVFNPFGAEPEKPTKPVRRIFPARGSTIRLEMVRQGSTLRYQVFDDVATQPREIGQFAMGPVDVAGVKLFASNRNGTDPLEVLFRELTVRADRISGLGTSIRTIFGTVVHGEPTAIEGGKLVIGGPPPTPAPGATPGPKPAPGPAAAPAPMPVAPAAPAAAAVVAPPVTVVTPNLTVTMTPVTIDQAPKPVQAAPAPAQAPASGPATPATPPKPKALIPLDEVDNVAFERSSMLAARWLGQPNIDTTMPGSTTPTDPKEAKEAKEKEAKEKEAKKPVPGDDLAAPPPGTAVVVKLPKLEPKPNGIRDLHLSLSSLREVAINQIMIQCQTDKGQSIWQLDTTGSTNSPITLRRAGMESWADLFLEPPAGDCFEKEFTITLTYADGQPANTRLKVTDHTDPKLAFDPEAPTPAMDARVFLAGNEQLFGKLESMTEETLTLTTPWGDKLAVPVTRVIGVYMGMPDHKETPEAFAKRLKTPGTEDSLLARSKDGEVVAITGVVEGSKANKLTFVYQGKSRTLPLKMVEGLILASRPGPKPPTEVRPTFSMAGGIVVSGRWSKIEAANWEVEAPWGQVIKLPANDVRTVRFQGGQMSFLSDLEPSLVEEIPYFSRRAPWRKDVSLSGQPLRLDGQAIEKGLAVHSRTVLTYDLNRRFASFETVVGFDDSGKKKGRVDCRVIADGKELYANPHLRADAPPVKLSLSVAGAEQLKLVIDFGPDEDTGDRVIWANARLYQRTSTASPAP